MTADGNAAPFIVRRAREDDIAAIQRIYNREVIEGVATFDEWPWSMDRRREWFDAHREAPVVVAVGPRTVLGFACLSSYGGKFGYRFTRELTVYVDAGAQRAGVGRALAQALIEEARWRRLHSLVARVEAGNAASLGLFAALGFARAGVEREVGYKHGRWLDVATLQLHLQPADGLEASVAPGFRVVTVHTAEEMAEVLAVRRSVFIEEQGISDDEEIDRYDREPPGSGAAVYVLGRLDGAPIATARLLLDFPPGERPHIGRVAVLREHRGRYFGVGVMRALHEEALRRGHRGVTLAAQEYVRRFYERIGYVARGELFLDAGIEHRWMDLNLGS